MNSNIVQVGNMKTIYMAQTIELIGSKNPQIATQLVESGTIKYLGEIPYVVIEELEEEIKEEN
jgi:hypothetical protein